MKLVMKQPSPVHCSLPSQTQIPSSEPILTPVACVSFSGKDYVSNHTKQQAKLQLRLF